MVMRALHLTSGVQVAAILVLLVCAGCNRLSPAEKKVVGEWQTYSIGGVIVNTIRADHTWTSVGGCLPDAGPTRGRWRVEGTDIVYEIDQHQYPDMPKLGPFRQPIQRLIDDDRQVRSWAVHPAAK
jgi:hypothetical protein